MKRFTQEEISYIKNNHNIISGVEIAKILNRSYQSVKHKIIALGLSGKIGKSKFSRYKRKYEFNDNFFEIPNLLNSYWAGFISADGCINNRSENQKSLSILLSKKDENHLIKFKNDILSNKPICYFKSNNFDACSLTLNSLKMVYDLENNFKIISRKSLINKPPDISDENASAFIVGYIDGDGCITVLKNDRVQIVIVGTFEMLSWIKEKCQKILGYSVGSINKKDNIFILTYSCKSARILIKYFKELNVPYLYRKWDKGLDLENTNKPQGHHVKKKITQLTLNGEILKSFNSITEANKFLGYEQKNTTITQCLTNRIKQAHGYKWKYIDMEEAESY